MAKKARVKQLEGRVIESAIIHYGDADASQPEDVGPSIEIRVSGGYVFTFIAQTKPVAVQAEASIYRDKAGTCEDEFRAIITETGADEQ